jgi:hypothetical protein
MSQLSPKRPPAARRFSSDPADAPVPRGGGIGLAIGSGVSHAVLLLACAASLMGCVITRDLDYEPPPNVPPSVEDPRTPVDYPMSSVIEWPTDSVATADGGVPELTLETEVRDPNVDQELRWQAYLDFSPAVFPPPNPFASGRLPPETDNTPRARTLRVTLPTELLSPGCHRVEVLVSERFRDPPFQREPADEEGRDLGVGVWWIAAFEGDNPVDMRECEL